MDNEAICDSAFVLICDGSAGVFAMLPFYGDWAVQFLDQNAQPLTGAPCTYSPRGARRDAEGTEDAVGEGEGREEERLNLLCSGRAS